MAVLQSLFFVFWWCAFLLQQNCVLQSGYMLNDNLPCAHTLQLNALLLTEKR